MDIFIRDSDKVLRTIIQDEESFQQKCFVKCYRGAGLQKGFDGWIDMEVQMLETGKASGMEENTSTRWDHMVRGWIWVKHKVNAYGWK